MNRKKRNAFLIIAVIIILIAAWIILHNVMVTYRTIPGYHTCENGITVKMEFWQQCYYGCSNVIRNYYVSYATSTPYCKDGVPLCACKASIYESYIAPYI